MPTEPLTAEATTATDPDGPHARIDEAAVAVSDDELVAQALAAEHRTVADDEAISYWDVVAPRDLGLLPAWYMPTPSAGTRRLRGWRRRVVYLVTGSIVALNAAGLCVTYGHVTLG